MEKRSTKKEKEKRSTKCKYKRFTRSTKKEKEKISTKCKYKRFFKRMLESVPSLIELTSFNKNLAHEMFYIYVLLKVVTKVRSLDYLIHVNRIKN